MIDEYFTWWLFFMKGIADKEAESIFFVVGRGTYCNLTNGK